MKKQAMLLAVVGLVAVAGYVAARAFAADPGEGQHHGGMMMGQDHGQMAGGGHDAHAAPAVAKTTPTVAEVAKAQTAKLAEVQAALDAARKAIEGGDSKAALAALDKAKAAVTSANESLAGLVPHVVNSKCPMMGGTPKADLTRQYKSQTVGFCCGMCPAQWDKLTDAQKDAAWAKASAAGKQ